MVKIEIEYDDGTAKAFDENENRIYYIKNGNLLEPTSAYFNGASYDKTRYAWKRNKRGAVSQAFYDWVEEFDKAVYNKHHNVEQAKIN